MASSIGIPTSMERTSTCPVEGRLRSRHRELLIVGTLRSRTTPSEGNQAVADLSLGISPRWCGREALRLELVWHKKAARLSWWRTTLLLATTMDNMLTTSSLHNRKTLEMEESDSVQIHCG